VRVRPADPDRDAAACAAIYAPHVDPGPASFEEVPPAAAEVARRMRSAHSWLVAEADDGTVAGFAYASRHRDRAAYRWAVDVAVYVAGSNQRQGVGRALYAALLPDLAARGFRAACAGIALPNRPSVALHEAFGFELVGIYRRIGFKAGAWRDVGWWQLDLAAGDDAPPPCAAPR
jgi:phosphinothricin acetyltransferase